MYTPNIIYKKDLKRSRWLFSEILTYNEQNLRPWDIPEEKFALKRGFHIVLASYSTTLQDRLDNDRSVMDHT